MHTDSATKVRRFIPAQAPLLVGLCGVNNNSAVEHLCRNHPAIKYRDASATATAAVEKRSQTHRASEDSSLQFQGNSRERCTFPQSAHTGRRDHNSNAQGPLIRFPKTKRIDIALSIKSSAAVQLVSQTAPSHTNRGNDNAYALLPPRNRQLIKGTAAGKR